MTKSLIFHFSHHKNFFPNLPYFVILQQHEAAAKRSEMEAYAQQQRAQNIEREAEEARKTLDAQTQHERHRAEYMDELERKRQVDMLNAQKYMQE